MMKLHGFFGSLIVTIILVIVMYLWVDRPVSYFAHDTLSKLRGFSDLTRIPEIFAVLAIVVFALAGLYVLVHRPLNKLTSVLLLCGISIAVASLIKEQLKYVFGRTWPETWINNNPSLIRDNAYGFHFFHGGAGYASFPSGHTTVTCAAAAVLWFAYPRYRPLWLIMALAVAIGLVGANYHFVSDVVAGAFIGSATGWISVLLWDTRGLPQIGPGAPSRVR